jgi:ubiquinol-cytochrome c reductase iron-sulfur subunit
VKGVRGVGSWLIAGLVLLFARGTRARREERAEPPQASFPPSRAAERAVFALLGAASLAASGFMVVYLLGADTQLLGLALGLALAFLAAAALVAGQRLVQQATGVESVPDRPAEPHVGATVEDVAVSRRRLLVATAGGTVGLVGAALILPAASLGPVLEIERLRESPWSPGRRLVDEDGRPIPAAELDIGSFLTAFPEDAEPRALDASVVLVRLGQDELDLPAERFDWAPDGILAYSKICTHAACAISLFRYPLFEPTSSEPALVCPCHYSTFDPRRAGKVVFGPAGRPLPQLPLGVDGDGLLVARGGFSAPPGPSWWGVRS